MPHLTGERRTYAQRQALKAIVAINEEDRHIEALIALMPRLAAKQRTHVLRYALNTAVWIWGEWGRAKILTDLAPALSSCYRAYSRIRNTTLDMFQN